MYHVGNVTPLTRFLSLNLRIFRRCSRGIEARRMRPRTGRRSPGVVGARRGYLAKKDLVSNLLSTRTLINALSLYLPSRPLSRSLSHFPTERAPFALLCRTFMIKTNLSSNFQTNPRSTQHSTIYFKSPSQRPPQKSKKRIIGFRSSITQTRILISHLKSKTSSPRSLNCCQRRMRF